MPCDNLTSNVKLCYEKQVGEPLRSQKTWANSRVGLFCSMNSLLFGFWPRVLWTARDCWHAHVSKNWKFDCCYCTCFMMIHFFFQFWINLKILKPRLVLWKKILTIMKYLWMIISDQKWSKDYLIYDFLIIHRKCHESLLTFIIFMNGVFHDYATNKGLVVVMS